MLILRPYIFRQFPEIIFGFSTKFGNNYIPPYYFNLSLSVNDDRDIVLNNRKSFFSELGLSPEKAAFQEQVHGDFITIVHKPGNTGESDAMITDKEEIALSISTADCTAVFIYDHKKKVIAAVHTGWRGTHKGITKKVMMRLKSEYKCDPSDLYVYLGPSVAQVNYAVGSEVAELFNPVYLLNTGDRIFLDVSAANYDMLLSEGIPSCQIQKSSLCSYEYNELLHSYRRDGKHSGRALGVIVMRELV